MNLSGFPRAAWLRAEKLVLEQASVADLGYGDPRGSQWLRTELAGWLSRTRGLRADPDDIIVVTGVAQALALLARVLRDLVAYAGSTSKTLAPGMRLGWLIPPSRLHADLVEAKHASDLGSPALPQLVLAWLIASGELEQHIRVVRTRQRSRRDALLRALREYLPAARVQGIAAGLHLLITFPGRSDPDTDLAEAILRAGVLVRPLSWHRQRPGVSGIVPGYAAHPPDRLHEAARRIAQVLNA